MLDAIPQATRHHSRVVGEFVGDVALEPAAVILQRLRQVPVVEAQPRRDATGHQTVDEAVVEIEAALLDEAFA
jgi:hypothetical protein